MAKRPKFVPLTAFQQQMARGHQIRQGHRLQGYYAPVVGGPGRVYLVRTCCTSA